MTFGKTAPEAGTQKLVYISQVIFLYNIGSIIGASRICYDNVYTWRSRNEVMRRIKKVTKIDPIYSCRLFTGSKFPGAGGESGRVGHSTHCHSQPGPGGYAAVG